MPYKKPGVIERIPLPSDSDYWVDWKPSVTYGELRTTSQAIERPAATPPNTQRPEAAELSQRDQELATDLMLLAHIAGWNLDDEQGNLLPVNRDSLAVLDEVDVNLLTEKLSARLQERDGHRKNSAKSSTASSTKPS